MLGSAKCSRNRKFSFPLGDTIQLFHLAWNHKGEGGWPQGTGTWGRKCYRVSGLGYSWRIRKESRDNASWDPMRRPALTPNVQENGLQLSRKMDSKAIICGNGSLPESLKIIASVAATIIYKRPARRESLCTVFAWSASGLEMLEQGREKKKSLFCHGKHSKGRQHVRFLLEFGWGLTRARLLKKVRKDLQASCRHLLLWDAPAQPPDQGDGTSRMSTFLFLKGLLLCLGDGKQLRAVWNSPSSL